MHHQRLYQGYYRANLDAARFLGLLFPFVSPIVSASFSEAHLVIIFRGLLFQNGRQERAIKSHCYDEQEINILISYYVYIFNRSAVAT